MRKEYKNDEKDRRSSLHTEKSGNTTGLENHSDQTHFTHLHRNTLRGQLSRRIY